MRHRPSFARSPRGIAIFFFLLSISLELAEWKMRLNPPPRNVQ